MDHRTPPMALASTLNGLVAAKVSDVSDREVEAETGIPRTTLRRALRDTYVLDIAEVAAIARYLGMRTSDLIAEAEAAA